MEKIVNVGHMVLGLDLLTDGAKQIWYDYSSMADQDVARQGTDDIPDYFSIAVYNRSQFICLSIFSGMNSLKMIYNRGLFWDWAGALCLADNECIDGHA